MGANEWTSPIRDPGASATRWDANADRFNEKPIPIRSDDEFLRMFFDYHSGKEESLLDIGCGAGQYSIAVSNEFDRLYGIDISPRMISFAREKAMAMGVGNVEYAVADWNSLDAQNPIMSRRYDAVFAHMTPAVDSADSVRRIFSVTRGRCYMARFAERFSRSREEIFTELGLEDPRTKDTMPALMTVLEELDADVSVGYTMTEFRREMPADAMKGELLSELRSLGIHSMKAMPVVERYVGEISDNGICTIDSRSKIALITWKR